MHLVSHPDVDKVAFTGSTGVGKLIHKAIAGTDKALTLELGGKAANIVFEDAALDQAVEGIVNGIYFNQGEVCCAGLAPARPGVDRGRAHREAQGPAVDDPGRRPARQEHRRRRDQLEEPSSRRSPSSSQPGVAEGAELYQPACDLPERGYFFRPTLFTNVAQSHRDRARRRSSGRCSRC